MLKKGFTLIELLVVIAIISIITSIGVANLITAQKQARDTARKEIVGNIQSAFEQYYAEVGNYPSFGTEGLAFDGGEAPTDPKNSGDYLVDYSHISDDEYCVCAMLENGTGNAGLTSSSQCNWDSTGIYYCAQNKQ